MINSVATGPRMSVAHSLNNFCPGDFGCADPGSVLLRLSWVARRGRHSQVQVGGRRHPGGQGEAHEPQADEGLTGTRVVLEK